MNASGSNRSELVYLTGFMASGKSSVGPVLANTLGWDFIDIDRFIENKTGKKITRIFEEEGEEYFRRLETETLQEISKFKKTVIALGGGSISNDDNFNIVRNSGALIYLKSSPEAIYKRLKFKTDRPLIQISSSKLSKEEIVKKIDELLQSRSLYYERSDFFVETDKTPLGICIEKIQKYLLKNFNA